MRDTEGLTAQGHPPQRRFTPHPPELPLGRVVTGPKMPRSPGPARPLAVAADSQRAQGASNSRHRDHRLGPRSRAPLGSLDPDCSREDWITIGMALQYAGHQSNDLERAMTLWDTWSAKGQEVPRAT